MLQGLGEKILYRKTVRSVYHKQGEENMGSFGLFGAVRREVKFIPKMPGSEPFWKRLQLGVLGYPEKLDGTEEIILTG